MNETFRIYALWTFGLSGLYALIYIAFTLERHRSIFLIILGLIALALISFWFRDRGVKQGWDRLDDGLIIAIILVLITVILMVIATFHACSALNTLPLKSDRTTSNMLTYFLRISPVALTAINVFNLLLFLAKE